MTSTGIAELMILLVMTNSGPHDIGLTVPLLLIGMIRYRAEDVQSDRYIFDFEIQDNCDKNI
jgi:hypothetical protein